ncbi:endodeoxyribonuclease [Candidatus Scalindua japonica]|uniref:Crossover junction endodeoxyribonuclease RuvC n=1 Tax=Candidatus Scalindua japonica TaxID=1284222 RepID=A0A286TUE3_9BACT|nr:crossover junction endodeoxyribonuclease RuvC [Candidatus Scalindua japonica]GAX59483.1 endodeoxyribonuclease [Candidatus Scalindua japonica]
MRVLGIDPGTLVTGFGIVDDMRGKLTSVDYGTIEGRRKDTFPDRLKIMFDGLSKAIEDYKPEHIALESAFYGKSVKAAIKIGEARGVAILCAAAAGIPLFEYAPTEVKRAVVGTGNAQKVQVGKMVKLLLSLTELPARYDATDALAIAICHCHRMKLPI